MKSENPQASADLTMEEKAAKFDELMASYKQVEELETRKPRAPARKAGLHLGETQLKKVIRDIGQISFAAASARRLAFDALDHEGVEWYLTAIENIAMAQARRCDVVLSYLGDDGIGHFSDEFERAPRKKSVRSTATES